MRACFKPGSFLALAIVLFAGWPAAAQQFSWDHVPLFAHLGKNSGDFTGDEVRFLASHFSLVTIAKAQALDQRGSTEAGNKVAVAQLKAANPKLKVLIYWNAAIDYDKMYQALQKPLPDAWFLSGKTGPWRRFDTSNPDFRRWWVDEAVDLVRSSGADGIFVDAVKQIAAHPQQLAAQDGQAKSAAMIDGAHKMLADLKSRLSGAIVIFNGLQSVPNGWSDGGADFLPDTSGAMVEEFAFLKNSSKEQIAADMELVTKAEAAGKIVLVKGWPANAQVGRHAAAEPAQIAADADRDLTFSLACFLIVASERSYFAYSWGWRAEEGWFHWYDTFDHELGPPLGPASRNGWSFERKFAHADVTVDLESRSAKIDWH
jgi:hypothetical protein